jgi:hypothetical protein
LGLAVEKALNDVAFSYSRWGLRARSSARIEHRWDASGV